MPSITEQLQFIFEGGAVQRFHSRPGIKPNTDAEHQWGVAMFCMLLSRANGYEPSSALLMAALTHDLAEQVVSDVSAPAKRLLGLGALLGDIEDKVRWAFELDYNEALNSEEKRILKIADGMDGMMYCCREAALGNRNVVLVMNRWETYISESALTGNELLIFSSIWDTWRRSNGLSFAGTAYGPEFDCFSYDYTKGNDAEE